MPVTDTHPLYNATIKQSTLTSDVIAGDDAVKAKKERYVPKLSEQSQEEYNSYLNRPVLKNYTARVLEGLLGLALSKEIQIGIPSSLNEIIKNISLGDSTIHDLAQDCINNVMADGRVGLLVDMPAGGATTKAEAERINKRPYVALYPNASIINWKYSTINNKIKLSLVVLKESVSKQSDDRFSNDTEVVYRVLSLDNGVYTVEVLRNDGTPLKEAITPMMNGKPMDYIPFIGILPSKLGLDPVIPPLYNMAKVNLAQFKLDVDFYHGMHFTALPTPYGVGVQLDKDEKVKIGSTTFMMFPDPQAKLEFLEFKGDGLGTIEREKDKLYETMVKLGSDLLLGMGNTKEAKETVLMRSKGQYSSLTAVCNSVSRGITKALEIARDWTGGNGEVIFKINTDFVDTVADAQTITAIVNAWLSGAISDKEKFNKLKADGVIDANKTYEQHKEEIELNNITVK